MAHVLVAVVAISANRVIGNGENLLWHLPDDLQRVKRLTLGKPLIMGRKTYESIGRALPERTNIVLTTKSDFSAKNVLVAHTPEEALALAEEHITANDPDNDEIIIFGGGEIYRMFLPQTSRIEMTEIDQDYEGETTFPELDPNEWHKVIRGTHPATDEHPAYSYVTLNRK